VHESVFFTQLQLYTDGHSIYVRTCASPWVRQARSSYERKRASQRTRNGSKRGYHVSWVGRCNWQRVKTIISHEGLPPRYVRYIKCPPTCVTATSLDDTHPQSQHWCSPNYQRARPCHSKPWQSVRMTPCRYCRVVNCRGVNDWAVGSRVGSRNFGLPLLVFCTRKDEQKTS
jgi:hypothetical protein